MSIQPVQLVALDRVAEEDLQHVIAGEPQPWGDVGETLRWRSKTHNLGVRNEDGRLVALGGLLLADVRVADTSFQVAGIGGVIVTQAARGRGLARMLVERLLEIGRELGAERAMLFCTPANVGLYEKLGFQLIEEPVFVHQPDGVVRMPMRTMWRPLTVAVQWPAGRVELPGEPF